MSKEPNRMSTQDDPENLPWQNSNLETRGVLHPPKPNSPIQFYTQSVIPSAWFPETTIELKGLSTTLAAGSLAAHLANKSPVITPATGSMTMGPHPIQINVSDHVTVTDSADSVEGDHEDSLIPADSEESVTNSESCTPIHQNADWVKQLSRGICRPLREQIFGDLCEIRAEMEAEGSSPSQIKWTTLSYLLSSILYGLSLIFSWLRNRFGWIMAIFK